MATTNVAPAPASNLSLWTFLIWTAIIALALLAVALVEAFVVAELFARVRMDLLASFLAVAAIAAGLSQFFFYANASALKPKTPAFEYAFILVTGIAIVGVAGPAQRILDEFQAQAATTFDLIAPRIGPMIESYLSDFCSNGSNALPRNGASSAEVMETCGIVDQIRNALKPQATIAPDDVLAGSRTLGVIDASATGILVKDSTIDRAYSKYAMAADAERAQSTSLANRFISVLNQVDLLIRNAGRIGDIRKSESGVRGYANRTTTFLRSTQITVISLWLGFNALFVKLGLVLAKIRA
jgi:hypothetical protein